MDVTDDEDTSSLCTENEQESEDEFNPLPPRNAVLPTPPPDVNSKIPKVIIWNPELKQKLLHMREEQNMSFEQIVASGEIPGSCTSLARCYQSIKDASTTTTQRRRSQVAKTLTPWSTKDMQRLVSARDASWSWKRIGEELFPLRTKHAITAAYRRAKRKSTNVSTSPERNRVMEAVMENPPTHTPPLNREFVVEMWQAYSEDRPEMLEVMKDAFREGRIRPGDPRIKWLLLDISES